MTIINSPRPEDIQAGDTVYLTHPKVTGEVGIKFDGTYLDFPNDQGTIEDALGVGFVITKVERVDRDKITIKGALTRRDGAAYGAPDTLRVVAVLPSGVERELYSNGVLVGSREATISLADFEG